MSTYADFLNLPPGALIKFTRSYQIVPPDEGQSNALIAPADTLAVVRYNKLGDGEQVINVVSDSSHVKAACQERMGHEDFDVGPTGESLSEDCPFDAV